MALTVGFIGLGTMGLPMARHIVNRGFRIKLYARRAEVFETERKVLSNRCDSLHDLSDVATDVDIIVTNVTGTDDVEGVLLGEEVPHPSPNLTLSSSITRPSIQLVRQRSHKDFTHSVWILSMHPSLAGFGHLKKDVSL